MAIHTIAGSVPAQAGAGLQTISGFEFVPKLLVFVVVEAANSDTAIANGLSVCWGFSDGVKTRAVAIRDTHAANPAATARAWVDKFGVPNTGASTFALTAPVGLTLEGFTFNWSGVPGTRVIHYLALGGTDFAAEVSEVQLTTGAGGGVVSGAHSLGSPADCAITIGAGTNTTAPVTFGGSNADILSMFGIIDAGDVNHGFGNVADDGQATTNTNHQHDGDSCWIRRGDSGAAITVEARITSFTDTGFNYSKVTMSNAEKVGVAFLKGVNAHIGSFFHDAIAGAHTQTVTGLAAMPKAGIYFGTSSTGFSNANLGGAVASIGFWDDSLRQTCASWCSRDNVSPANCVQGGTGTSAFMRISSGAVLEDVGAISAIGSSSFEINWTKKATLAALGSLLYFTNITSTGAARQWSVGRVSMGGSSGW